MADETKAPARARNGHPLRRDPFTLLEEFEREIGPFFGPLRPFGLGPIRLVGRPVESEKMWLPQIDVFEKNGSIVVKAELPGLKKEDVDVSLEEDGLVIQGERKSESEVKEEDYYRMERSYGRFCRKVPLPTEIKPDQIKATFTDGVLEIQAAKPVEQKPEARKIKVA